MRDFLNRAHTPVHLIQLELSAYLLAEKRDICTVAAALQSYEVDVSATEEVKWV